MAEVATKIVNWYMTHGLAHAIYEAQKEKVK